MTAERSKPLRATIGFGVPDAVDPHCVVVHIPKKRDAPVLVEEHFGVSAAREGQPDLVERLKLTRARWSAIADTLRRVFNERLKEKNLSGGRWTVGENRVERLLGKELLVLGWAIEKAEEELVPAAITNWSGLKPEERWWLCTMTTAATGGLDDGEIGWRKALRFALTENPTTAEELAKSRPPKARTTGVNKRRRKGKATSPVDDLPLFAAFERKEP